MSTQLPEPLQQATVLLSTSKLDEARAMLSVYLRDHPDSEQAWFLLSQAVTDPARQQDCLQRVLRLNPNHGAARERLAELRRRLATSVAPAGPQPLEALLPARRTPTTAPLTRPAPPAPAQPWLPDDRLVAGPPVKPALPDSLQKLRDKLIHSAAADKSARAPRRGLRLPRRLLIAFDSVLVVAIIVLSAFGLYVLGLYKPQPIPPLVVPLSTVLYYPTMPPSWTNTPPPSQTTSPSVMPAGTPTPGAPAL